VHGLHATEPNLQAFGDDTRNSSAMSGGSRKRRFAGTSHAGGGTRTPDTRIMILGCFGSVAPFAGAGGQERGHVCAQSSPWKWPMGRGRALVKSQDVVEERGASFVGEDVGGSGRLELGDLLFVLIVVVIVSSVRTREIDSAER
jgi:hypothetical protein